MCDVTANPGPVFKVWLLKTWSIHCTNAEGGPYRDGWDISCEEVKIWVDRYSCNLDIEDFLGIAC